MNSSWHAFAKQISYSDHCSSTVPETTLHVYNLASTPFSEYQAGYYTGGGNIPGLSSSSKSNSFSFYVCDVYKTNHDGVLKVEANLRFGISGYDYYYGGDYRYGQACLEATPVKPAYVPRHRAKSPITFRLEGFWSESSEKLCMVGSSLSNQGDSLNLDVVLKLNNVSNSTKITSLFTGILESLSTPDDKNYFDAISILMFPKRNYKYSLVFGELSNGKSNLPLGIAPTNGSFCSVFRNLGSALYLNYTPDCSPVKICTPISGPSGYLPPVMSLNGIGCSEGERKMRVLLRFSNDSDFWYYGKFDPNSTLVGEAMWDETKNRLQIKACQINLAGSFSTARVEDCSVHIELMFPAVWSIRERDGILGHLWSEKSQKGLSYFPDITLQGTGSSFWEFPDLKYNYTEIERVRKLCPVKTDLKSGRERYPNWYSQDMRFSMLVKNSEGKIGSGYSYPLFGDNHMYDQYGYSMSVSRTENFAIDTSSTSSSNARFNISYHIDFTGPRHVKGKSKNALYNQSWSSNDKVEISAEGVYDAETGDLCMVGCKSVISTGKKRANTSPDCEIVIRLQFPPLSKRRQDHIVGTIESTRKSSDPLHFERLNVTSDSLYLEEVRRSIFGMDIELSLVLASNTFLCIFIGLQILHVKRHPEVLPFISIAMLVILTLGHAIPLVLNFEALFLNDKNGQHISLGSGQWLEMNEVLVRVATMIAFLMQFRLLQLSWAARKKDGVGAVLWFQEKKALIVSLLLYGIGALAAIIFSWRSHSNDTDGQSFSILGGLKCYAGLILDGFLLPQILLNVFRNSSERALSGFFYLGMTLVRLLPHGYDLYRTRTYSPQFYRSYIYGTPDRDFYSTAWDVVIPLGGLVFAAVIFLQQQFCGACILPKRFRNSVAYQKVPAVVDDAPA
ncbi:uncharacterized protein LOC104451511 [Eucalyptus grandis]|uniref:uncharacterized protein LOC104451511 n=1 Tax=Eucalyptus grandis TaxID=71139 RepID=UPI00192F0350|nr:uncharacterized protein LOC104451511 [Eucalyptus grandis]